MTTASELAAQAAEAIRGLQDAAEPTRDPLTSSELTAVVAELVDIAASLSTLFRHLGFALFATSGPAGATVPMTEASLMADALATSLEAVSLAMTEGRP